MHSFVDCVFGKMLRRDEGFIYASLCRTHSFRQMQKKELSQVFKVIVAFRQRDRSYMEEKENFFFGGKNLNLQVINSIDVLDAKMTI